MSKSVFQRAKEIAMNNGESFHLAAILYRGKNLIKIGTNSSKTHPKFKKVYKNGDAGYQLHAETDVLRFAEPGDSIIVLRWNAHGKRTMAKPCDSCENFLRMSGIIEVTYSDWDGDLRVMEL